MAGFLFIFINYKMANNPKNIEISHSEAQLLGKTSKAIMSSVLVGMGLGISITFLGIHLAEMIRSQEHNPLFIDKNTVLLAGVSILLIHVSTRIATNLRKELLSKWISEGQLFTVYRK